MSEYVDIYALRVTNPSQRPVNPKHWVVMIKQFGGKPWEFKRGGLMTENEAMRWCKTLVNDYEDATEIFAYELSKPEYANRLAY